MRWPIPQWMLTEINESCKSVNIAVQLWCVSKCGSWKHTSDTTRTSWTMFLESWRKDRAAYYAVWHQDPAGSSRILESEPNICVTTVNMFELRTTPFSLSLIWRRCKCRRQKQHLKRCVSWQKMWCKQCKHSWMVSSKAFQRNKLCDLRPCPMIAFFERACTPLSGAGKQFWRQADKSSFWLTEKPKGYLLCIFVPELRAVCSGFS